MSDDAYLPVTRELVIFTRSPKRWFDLDAVRAPGNSHDRTGETKGHLSSADHAPEVGSGWMDGKPLEHHPAGAPPLDTWIISDDYTPTESDVTMGEARYLIGDVFDRLAQLPDGSVDLVLTSPPFLALRSYLPADHPDKGREIGSEPDPAAFVDTLLALTAEWSRVLAPHGSIAVELGDTYSDSSQRSGDMIEGSGSRTFPKRHADPATTRQSGGGWPLAKSLALIPELYRIGLAYGINPLTGAESPAGRWRVRNVVRWHRPNPPVGALGDKYRPATSDLVVACQSGKRWFDLDAVRTPAVTGDRVMWQTTPTFDPNRANGAGQGERMQANNPAGAPPLDTWVIPTHPYKGSHYATFPPELCRIPIESMCPRHVCRECGEPRRRITGEAEYRDRKGMPPAAQWETGTDGVSSSRKAVDNGGMARHAETLGWSDCGHDDYRLGVVLDPFAGSGTTLAVATGHGRDAIGIDLDSRNAELARQRVGMFLTVDDGAHA